MIFIFFKFIFCIGFMINMQFSNIDCNADVVVVALLKIVLIEGNSGRSRFVPESYTSYNSRNPMLFDPRTNMPYLFHVVLQRMKYDNEVENEAFFNINKDGQLIMRESHANKSLSTAYLSTMNIMKQKEIIHGMLLADFEGAFLTDFRQQQYYRYLLYPHNDENIREYWNRVDHTLKSCLKNNTNFDFINVKEQYIDIIRKDVIFVLQVDGETDNQYLSRLKKNHKWFENMISTRPINGEDMPNYHLRMIRLGVTSLKKENLEIFYSDFILYAKDHLKINEIKNNFSDIEFFVTHIIYHCQLPASEKKHIYKEPNRSKNVRGESSQSQDHAGKRSRIA